MMYLQDALEKIRLFLACMGVVFCVASTAFGEAHKTISLPAGKSGIEISALLFSPKETPVFAAIYSYGAIVEREGISRAAKSGYDARAFGRELARRGALTLIPMRRPEMDGPQAVMASYSYLLQKGFEPQSIAFIGFSKGGGITLSAVARLKAPGPVVLMSPALGHNYLNDFIQLNGPILLTLGLQDPVGIRESVLGELLPYCGAHKSGCSIHQRYPGNHKWFWKVRGEVWDDIGEFLTGAVLSNEKK